MTLLQSRMLFLNQLVPNDTLAKYGEKAAINAISSVTAFIESEARRFARFYPEFSDGQNTFVIFANMVSDLTAERVEQFAESERRHD